MYPDQLVLRIHSFLFVLTFLFFLTFLFILTFLFLLSVLERSSQFHPYMAEVLLEC